MSKERLFVKFLKTFFILGILTYGGYLGLPIYRDYQKIQDYTRHFTTGLNVDPQNFIPTDASLLELYAEKFEQLFEFHFPRNLTGDGSVLVPCDLEYDIPWDSYFNNNLELLAYYDPLNQSHPFTKVLRYYIGGHASVYAGYIMGGQAFRYAVACQENNETARLATLCRIQDLINGYRILVEISGDGSLVRYAVPDTTQARNLFESEQFTEGLYGTHLFTKVQYRGLDWYVESSTSVDTYIGTFFGLGCCYAFCDEPNIRMQIKTLVNQMLDYFMRSGWKFIDLDGKSHMRGNEILINSPTADSKAVLAFLQVGKLCDPQKWADIYRQYLIEKNYLALTARREYLGNLHKAAWALNYFQLCLDFSTAFLLTYFEIDPYIRTYLQENLVDPMYKIIFLHQNGYFDCIYYLCHSAPPTDLLPQTLQSGPNRIELNPETKSFVEPYFSSLNSTAFLEKSIGDQLMRYSLRRFPDRTYYMNLNDSWFTENYPYIEGANYPNLSILYLDVGIFTSSYISNEFSNVGLANNTLPIDLRPPSTFPWEKNPFAHLEWWAGGHHEVMGGYTTLYWMACYSGLISRGGN